MTKQQISCSFFTNKSWTQPDPKPYRFDPFCACYRTRLICASCHLYFQAIFSVPKTWLSVISFFVYSFFQGISFQISWVVHTLWHQRFWSEIMDHRLIYGVPKLFCISCYVGFRHFGQVLPQTQNIYIKFCGLLLIWYLYLLIAETEQGVALSILRGVIDFKRESWPQISENAKSLVKQMLEPDPKKRLTSQQVLGKFKTSHLTFKVTVTYYSNMVIILSKMLL